MQKLYKTLNDFKTILSFTSKVRNVFDASLLYKVLCNLNLHLYKVSHLSLFSFLSFLIPLLHNFVVSLWSCSFYSLSTFINWCLCCIWLFAVWSFCCGLCTTCNRCHHSDFECPASGNSLFSLSVCVCVSKE